MIRRWLGISALFLVPIAYAAIPEYRLVIENNLFYPSTMHVPADIKFRLVIENKDDDPEEFDSFDLNREKVIFGKRSATIYVGPLKPGEYHYFGEYNPNSARGKIIAILPEQFVTPEQQTTSQKLSTKPLKKLLKAPLKNQAKKSAKKVTHPIKTATPETAKTRETPAMSAIIKEEGHAY